MIKFSISHETAFLFEVQLHVLIISSILIQMDSATYIRVLLYVYINTYQIAY